MTRKKLMNQILKMFYILLRTSIGLTGYAVLNRNTSRRAECISVRAYSRTHGKHQILKLW